MATGPIQYMLVKWDGDPPKFNVMKVYALSFRYMLIIYIILINKMFLILIFVAIRPERWYEEEGPSQSF